MCYDLCGVFQVICIHVMALCEEQNDILTHYFTEYLPQTWCINDTCMSLLHKCRTLPHSKLYEEKEKQHKVNYKQM